MTLPVAREQVDVVVANPDTFSFIQKNITS